MATLWRHKNKVYYVRWQDNGRNRRKSLQTTDKRIAVRRFNNFQRELIAGKVRAISQGLRRNLYPFVEEFLEHIESRVEYSTYTLYRVALNKAKSCWGDIPLSHITNRHIDVLVQDMLKAGLKPVTVNKNYRHIKSALNKAYQWGYITAPIKFPKPLREEQKVRYLTKEQLSSLLRRIDDAEFSDFCLFSAYTGLRSGEIIRLKWTDIDNPEKGIIRISAKQKNKKEAWIPVNRQARAILDRCRQRGGYKVFRFNTLTWVSQKFKSYAKQAGLEKARFHDLRHTYGTYLAMSGENERAIQKLMRHKSITSTLIYTDVSMEYLKQTCEKINYGPMPVGTGRK